MSRQTRPRRSPRGVVEAARQLRRRMTPAEAMLWRALRRQQADGLRFRKQHPLGPYILDFYCHARRLVVEVDGGIHEDHEVQERDRRRTINLHAAGLTVIRFSNADIVQRLDVVLARILSHTES